MNKKYFLNISFSEGEQTKLSCPYCEEGRLEVSQEKVNAGTGREIDYIDPDDAHFKFSGLLKCNHDKCKEVVSVCGQARIFRLHDDSPDGWSWHENYVPKWFYPNLKLFVIPDACPAVVATSISNSFSSFFSDPMASGMHLRVATERLMDQWNIPIEATNKKGDEYRLNLHRRIEIYSETEKELGDSLLAIKWLGNDASHQGSLTQEDVIEGYELFAFVLHELYINRAMRVQVAKTASNLTKKFST